jgi:hypothetical protein
MLLRFRVMDPATKYCRTSTISLTGVSDIPGDLGDLGDHASRKRSASETSGERRYALLPVDREFHMEKYKELSRLASVLRGTGAPRTFTAWCAVTGSIANVIGQSKSLGALNRTTTYGYLWMIRAFLLAEMRAEGIDRLKVSADDLVSNISAAFPDASDWASQLGRLIRQTHVKDLIQVISWKGPVELLTCFLCVLLSEPRVHHLSANRVRSLCDDLIKARSKFRKQYRGFEPHPLAMLSEVGLLC